MYVHFIVIACKYLLYMDSCDKKCFFTATWCYLQNQFELAHLFPEPFKQKLKISGWDFPPKNNYCMKLYHFSYIKL